MAGRLLEGPDDPSLPTPYDADGAPPLLGLDDIGDDLGGLDDMLSNISLDSGNVIDALQPVELGLGPEFTVALCALCGESIRSSVPVTAPLSLSFSSLWRSRGRGLMARVACEGSHASCGPSLAASLRFYGLDEPSSRAQVRNGIRSSRDY